MLTALLTLLPSALAVEVTHIPPFLRGDVQVGYEFDLENTTLLEDGDQVGRMVQEQHRMRYAAVFGAAPGAAVFVELPSYIRDRVGFRDGREMVFEPTTEQGNLTGGAVLDPQPAYEGSGFGGTWIGARGTPISESLYEGHGFRATWLLEFGYRFIDNTNFWVEGEDGRGRGGGPGGPATRWRTAFSAERGAARPYVQGMYQHEGWYQTDLYDSEGQVIGADAVITPRRTVDVLTGLEVTPYEDDVRGSSFSFDFRMGWEYHSPGEVPSGIYLPSVLSSTAGTVVTTSEYTSFKAGIGLYYRPFTYMKFDLYADAAYLTPYKIEHPYEVYAGYNTLNFSGGVQLEILIRAAA